MKELELIKILWDYMQIKSNINKADCIIVLGCKNINLVDVVVNLYNKKYADKIIFCGGLGKITKNIWDEPEAEKFANLAIEKGVPKQAIYIENKSTNTGDNLRFAKKIIQENNLDIKTCIVVCNPYDVKRNYATFKKILPEYECCFTTEKISCEEYYRTHSKEWIDVLVGDIQRMKVYPKYGWQIEVDIPNNVWKAFEDLEKLGYNKYVLK